MPYQYCRFCGEERSPDELLDLKEDKSTLYDYYQKMEFLKIDYIDLTNSFLPKTTCEYCYDAFNDAFDFFKKVKQAQEKWNGLFNAKIDYRIEENENDFTKDVKKSTIQIEIDIDCADHVVCGLEPEPLNIKTEDDFDPLSQQNFSSGPVAQDTNKICKLTNTNKTYENIDCTDNINKHSKTHNDIKELINKFKTESEREVATTNYINHDKSPRIDKDYEMQSKEVYLIKKDDKSGELSPRIDDDNQIQSVELQAEELTPTLHTNEDGTVSIKLCYQSTYHNDIPSTQDLTINTNAKTDLMYEDVTSMSNNCKEIISESVEDVSIESEDEYLHEVNKDTKFISWEGYKWFCRHCEGDFNSMSEVRNHSKYVHNTCFGFKCADCPEWFRRFNPFIEHVRNRHMSLRLYCQYCNSKFDSPEECVTHTFSHWRETTVCEYCGEILPNIGALESHKRSLKKVKKASIMKKKPKVVAIYSTKSWNDYDWSCQDCWMRMPDASSLRTHVQNVHHKCFAMKCVDCLLVVQDYVLFVNHVRKHRPYLHNYCQFCNMHIEEKHKLTDHITEHCHVCHTCGHMFADNTELLQHIEQYNVHKVKNVPQPVNTNTTCDVCQKTYPSPISLKKHVWNAHKGKRQRDFICQTCGKAYLSCSTLQNHIKTHGDKTEKCEFCGKMFLSKSKLKSHAKTHLQERPFSCDICGQTFIDKLGIRMHIIYRHADIKKAYTCIVCRKTFKTNVRLRSHERQHTGARPYSCEVCERTFTCWGNCNKHMLRKHGVTLAKTKKTARGKLDIINKKTGETKDLASEHAEKWLYEITNNK